MPHLPGNAFPEGYESRLAFIPVTLSHAGTIAQRIDTLIDTGSEWTLYSKSIADSLGIVLNTGRPEIGSGVGGGSNVWFHKIRLNFGKWSYKCNVGFLEIELPVDGILGYVGLFDRFKYTIDVANHNFTLERLPNIYK